MQHTDSYACNLITRTPQWHAPNALISRCHLICLCFSDCVVYVNLFQDCAFSVGIYDSIEEWHRQYIKRNRDSGFFHGYFPLRLALQKFSRRSCGAGAAQCVPWRCPAGLFWHLSPQGSRLSRTKFWRKRWLWRRGWQSHRRQITATPGTVEYCCKGGGDTTWSWCWKRTRMLSARLTRYVNADFPWCWCWEEGVSCVRVSVRGIIFWLLV